jgi:uncharacterized membrane protein
VQSLRKWRIQADTFSTAKENLQSIPLPFIACLGSENNLFVTVMAIRDGKVEYADPKGGSRRIVQPQETFMKEWNGIFVMAKAEESPEPTDFHIQAKKEHTHVHVRNTAIGVLAAYLLLNTVRVCILQAKVAPYVVVLLLLQLVGVFVTTLLLRLSSDPTDSLTQRFCVAGGRINCHSILQSQGAKIFDWLSWSEVGVLYFSGSTLYILLNAASPAVGFIPLVWLNALSIPYVAFSLFYQWKIARYWCPLCLTVQAILLLQSGCFWLGWWQQGIIKPLWDLHLLNSLIMAFLPPILCLFILKPLIARSRLVPPMKRQLTRIKMNKQVFSALLSQEEPIEGGISRLGIFLGNPEAGHILTIISGTNCALCHTVHQMADELLEEVHNLQIQILFLGAGNSGNAIPGLEEGQPGMDILFMAIYCQQGQPAVREAMGDWSRGNKKDPSAYGLEHIAYSVWKEASEQVEAMHRWCREAGLFVTPTLFFNGRRLPDGYSVQDLKHFLA